ncbi:hypothetical protein JCM10908_004365 [Rhodotorula pacifica]|uniref:uncharacterized protein n=1 Tax=Rhodotorula pacifica TaxID=1495444 RepID=UPI00316D51A3
MASLPPSTRSPADSVPAHASLSDSELSDAAASASPGDAAYSLNSMGKGFFYMSSTSPRFMNPVRKLEKRFIDHEAKRTNERLAVYETMPDSTNATHDPPFLPDQPRSANVNIMGNLGAACAPHPTAIVDVAGDLLAVACDVHVQISSISTGITAMHLLGMGGVLTDISTAVCFSHDGDRLWVGSIHGKLYELDVTQFRQNPTRSWRFPEVGHRNDAHSPGAMITLIQRMNEGRILTLDATGRFVVWHPDEGLGRVVSLHSHSDLFNIPPHPCFAHAMHGMLWVGYKDATASGTSASCLRIFDFSGSTAVEHPAGETRWLTAKLGRITASCAVPLHPHWVTGHVSVWDADSGAMLDVERISKERITAMIGPSRHLWVGGSTGLIEVIDVFSPGNWRIVKRFQAHEGKVAWLGLDLLSLWTASSIRIWSVGDDRKVHFWDGCLRDDWIAATMDATVDDYCTFSSLKVGVLTWNVDGQSPSLLNSTTQQNKEVLLRFIHDLDNPDMIVFNLQEAIDLSDLTLAARTVLFATETHDVTGRYRHWCKALLGAINSAMPGAASQYRAESVLAGLYSMIWWRGDTGHSISEIAAALFKLGFDEMYGNKGCIATAFMIDDSPIAFVNAHLPAGATHSAARTYDLARYFDANPIFHEEKRRHPDPHSHPASYRRGGDGTRLLDMDTIFFAGDLNFRVQLPREEVLHTLESSSNAIKELLQHDELTQLKKNDPHFRLRDFKEAEITFPPTYKYDHFTDRYDTSKKQRTPSWCDRILWHSDQEKDVKCLFYRQYDANMSDHKPVGGCYILRTRKVDEVKRQEAYGKALQEWIHVEQGLLGTARMYFPPYAQGREGF